MPHQHPASPRPPAAQPPRPGQPDNDEADWERVLDCGAPGPDHAAPALFYQPGRPPAPEHERPAPDEE